MELSIYAFQLDKNMNLDAVQTHFGLMFNKSIDGSYNITIDESKHVFYYRFNVIVFFGFRTEEIDFIFEKISKQKLLINNTIKTKIYQDYRLVLNPELINDFMVSNNYIEIKKYDFNVIEIISLAIAQSVALEYYEIKLNDFFPKMKGFYKDLAKHGKLSYSTKYLLKYGATALSIRHDIIGELYLLDKPDIIWDHEALEKLYESLYRFFDIPERFKSLEYKLNLFSEDVSFLTEIVNHKNSHFLEIVVILLIFIEIVFYVMELFYKK